MPRLDVAVIGGGGAPSRPVDLHQRVALARRLLHDHTLDPADRVAGMLVTIYAQPLARVVRLTWDDVDTQGEDVSIMLGNDALLVPDPLGQLLRQLPWRRQVGIGGKVAADQRWLFPGRQAGRPQHPEHVRKRLAAIGISCRRVRNAALFELAREVPAAVLADMLGLHASTAVRWVERAGGNWTHYAAGRTTTVSAT
jgi:integrase